MTEQNSPMVIKTIAQIKQAVGLKSNQIIGFVPTMGALHEGHLSLVRRAELESDLVVVSIFVNPTQFGPNEDFNEYPRTLDHDIDAAEAAGADILFVPEAKVIYPLEPLVKVSVDGLDRVLCGRCRPGHFTGVATIVVKLLNIIKPRKVYFGMKDWQQLTIVKRVTEELNIDVEIVAVPTVRDHDGLALSSRNKYLSRTERQKALALPRAIAAAAEMIRAGGRDSAKIIAASKEIIVGQPDVTLEYFTICKPDMLSPVETIEERVLVAAAVNIGGTRLIDNTVVEI